MTLSHAHSSPQKPDRVVVVGSSGFIGVRLIRACAAEGIPAVGLSSGDVDLADASAGPRLAERLRPKDVLVFLAALTPNRGRDSRTLMRNLLMAQAVCEASRAVELTQVVYASSDTVYAFDAGLISEMTPAAPTELYGAMHRMRELMLAAELKAPLAILRYTAIYGAGDTHDSYGPNRFLRQALTDACIPLFGNGEETRDHLHIDDAVAILMRVILRGSTGLLNLASGTSETFHAVANMIAAQVAADRGRPIRIEASARQNAVTHRHFDTTDLIRAFPDVRFTALTDGLAKALAERDRTNG
jgi:nucleoside-diphosphate-sugar epimerase